MTSQQTSATGADLRVVPAQTSAEPSGRRSGQTATQAPPAPATRTALADEAASALRRHRDGDPQALDDLVRLVNPLLWHLARGYGLQPGPAEDVVQTTWLTLVRRGDSIVDPQAVLRWLTVTTRRESWRVARAAQRSDRATGVDPGDEGSAVIDLADPAPGPEDIALQSATDRALWRAVVALPERCQRLLRVIAFSDRPDYVALSKELDMPVGSIGPTRGRCLDKLRGRLAADPEWSRS